jgi:hypothetical protein
MMRFLKSVVVILASSALLFNFGFGCDVSSAELTAASQVLANGAVNTVLDPVEEFVGGNANPFVVFFDSLLAASINNGIDRQIPDDPQFPN